ncbi:response regulator transcription factor [Anaerolineales bacterium HSG24]|nr:response regulator transcription factor [Anaerolineales bacterium HSG24]
MPDKILVIEDEERIYDFIERGLKHEGYQVLVAVDGETGLEKTFSALPDLIILDIMLPGIDGLNVCRQIRETELQVPILMLTAKDAVPDRVAGLEMGADDYLVKPFAFEELLARIRALSRRRAPIESDAPLIFADLWLDPSTRMAERNGRNIELTAKEYDLLELFMRHPKQVLTRNQIYDRIWGYDFGGESNIIEVYVRYLRAKLEAMGEIRLLHTVRCVGYALREP